jgi:vancomycin permeability regulator SanA
MGQIQADSPPFREVIASVLMAVFNLLVKYLIGGQVIKWMQQPPSTGD